jgi:hypothetical protein
VPDDLFATLDVVRRVNWCECLKAHGDHSLGSGGDGEFIEGTSSLVVGLSGDALRFDASM